MTNDTNALMTFDQLVQGMMLKGDHPESDYVRMLQIAIDGYRELNLTVLPMGRAVEKFDMDSNYIIYFPDDLIKVNRVCLSIDGKLWPLTQDTEIVPTTSLSGMTEILDPDDGEGVDISKLGTFYSRRGGRNIEGYYTVDDRKRRIIFRNVSRTDVLLDYTTSGTDTTVTTYLPTYAKTALEAYIRLFMEYNKLEPNPNKIALFQNLYNRQKGICRMIKFSITDFLDTVYSTYSPTVYR